MVRPSYMGPSRVHERDVACPLVEVFVGGRRVSWSFRSSILVAIILGLILGGLPALAHNESNAYFYDGTYCGWWGANEYYDPGKYAYAAGVTSIAEEDRSVCGPGVQVKVRWSDATTWQCKTTVYTRTNLYAFNTGQITPALHLDWTDHDIYRDGVWYGWKLDHAGDCYR